MSAELVTSDIDTGSKAKKKKSPFWQGETKPYPGSIFVRKGSRRIYIQYKKKRVATGLPLTRVNIQIAIAMVTDLWRDYHGYPTLKTTAAVTLLPLSPAPAPPSSGTDVPMSESASTVLAPEVSVASKPIPEVVDEPEQETAEPEKAIPTIGEAIVEYTDVYLASRDLEEKTVGGYVDAMNYIAVDRDLPVTHDNLVAQVQNWLLTADKHFSSGSINTHLRAFRTLTTWLVDTKKILTDRVSYRKYWRKKDAEAEVLIYAREVLDILIYYYEECEPPKGYSDGYLREMAELLKLLRAVGTRIKETITLVTSQFVLGRIAIPNKITKKVDYIPMTDEVQGILDRIAAIRAREAEMQADPNNKLYVPSLRQDYHDGVDRSDRIFRWSEASISSLLRHIKKTMKLLQLDIKGGWHTFRRTFADDLHQADIDLHTRQRLLRHASPETTVKFYTYTHNDRLKGALEKAASRMTIPLEERAHTPH